MEESKEPEKPEVKAAEEEQPSRTEEDREVHRIILDNLYFWLSKISLKRSSNWSVLLC